MTDPIEDLAELVRRYYGELRQRGIPEALALRMAGDWHQAVLAAALGEEQERAVPVANRVTRQAVKVGRSHV